MDLHSHTLVSIPNQDHGLAVAWLGWISLDVLPARSSDLYPTTRTTLCQAVPPADTCQA